MKYPGRPYLAKHMDLQEKWQIGVGLTVTRGLRLLRERGEVRPVLAASSAKSDSRPRGTSDRI